MLFYVRFYISRYDFSLVFRGLYNITWKKFFLHEFSFFNWFTQTPHLLNSQNPLSVTKVFCRCTLSTIILQLLQLVLGISIYLRILVLLALWWFLVRVSFLDNFSFLSHKTSLAKFVHAILGYIVAWIFRIVLVYSIWLYETLGKVGLTVTLFWTCVVWWHNHLYLYPSYSKIGNIYL